LAELFEGLSPDRVVLLRGATKQAALGELVDAVCGEFPKLRRQAVLEAVMARENTITSRIARGIAVPHARLPGLGRWVLAVGRSLEGVAWDGADADPVHLLFLILGDAAEPDRHILLLAEMVRTLRDPAVIDDLMRAKDAASLRRALRQAHGKTSRPPEINRQRLTQMLLDHALAVAREVHARAVMVHSRSPEVIRAIGRLETEQPIVLVSDRAAEESGRTPVLRRMLLPAFTGLSRAKQVEVSLLFGVYEGFFSPGDRIVSLSGASDAGYLDTLTVVEAGSGLAPALTGSLGDERGDVAPQILERALQIAVDLAREGREGKPVGAIFVLGDYEVVVRSCQQMVINPFRGYRDDEKSLMDPFLEETIKEFAAIDGAFLIRGDGVVMAAGAFLRPGEGLVELQAGLGSRHIAAAAITAASRAVSIVISESTGIVTVFKGGKQVIALDKLRR
jgi:DNA integrity scanning protein DisA with diadenylate cyclase activity/mannitol/fructose-specific phosphotransferase system IIA component (Ntr-type)